ncbi:MAG: hypothetical protein KC635_15235 [Myxococcales bacterium]|nr:hypothetical protein [Myxococcales bacterium]MCB9735181.1 hypothetical protein [Deltaproteobacteria bacterium]
MDEAVDAALRGAVHALAAQRVDDAVAALVGLLEGELDAQSEMLACGLLAPALVTKDRLDEARVYAGRAAELAEALGDEDGQRHYGRLLEQLAVAGLEDEAVDRAFDRAGAALERGDSAAAELELMTLLTASVRQGRPDVEASAAGMLAQALLMRGDAGRARAHLERAAELARAMGDPGATAHFEGLLAQTATAGGAEKYQREAEATRRGDDAMRAAGEKMSANDFAGAVVLLDAAVADAVAAGVRESEASLRGMLSQALLLAEERPRAAEEARKAKAIAKALGAHDAAESFAQIEKLAVGFIAPKADG